MVSPAARSTCGGGAAPSLPLANSPPEYFTKDESKTGRILSSYFAKGLEAVIWVGNLVAIQQTRGVR